MIGKPDYDSPNASPGTHTDQWVVQLLANYRQPVVFVHLDRLPKCNDERRRHGYSKIVGMKPGEFGWVKVMLPVKMTETYCRER